MERIDNLVKSGFGKLSRNFKLTFISVLVIGFIAHTYMFTNKLPNFDDLCGINSFGVTFKNGRWFLWIIGSLLYHLDMCYSLPWFNGIVTLALIGIATGIISDMLNIKSDIGNILLGAAIIVFPSWTGTFFYMFTTVFYAIAFLMEVLSVWLARKYKKGWLASIIMMAFSLGIYQAYLPFTATLYVVLLMLECYDENIEWGKTLKTAFYYLGCIMGALAIYFIFMKLSLIITGQSLNAYKGLDSMGRVSLSRIPEILGLIGTDFFGVFINNNLEISYNLITKTMYFVLFMIDFILISGQVIRLFKAKKNLKGTLLIVFVCCYVLAINGIYIMCEDGVYSLMCFSYVFMMILPLCLLDREIDINKMKGVVEVEYILTFALTAGIICYCQYANGQYLSMDLSYRQAEAYYTTLITQIKSADGYTSDTPVCIIGSFKDDSTLYRNDIMSPFSMSGRNDALADADSWQYLVKLYCGFDTEYVDSDELDLEQSELDSMPCYPDSGSIKLLNGVIVVKLSE